MSKRTIKPILPIPLGLPVHCHKCGHDWYYKGASKYYAACPMCHKNVKLDKFIEEVSK